MAKATLRFDLNDGDDKMAHMRAIKSTDMAIVLHEIFYNLHRRIEQGIDAEHWKTPYEAVDAYREAIRDLFVDQGLNIDELIK